MCVLLGNRHVCGGHTGNEGARSQNAARFPRRHLVTQKASGYAEVRVSALMYRGAKSGTASLVLTFISKHLRLYLACLCEGFDGIETNIVYTLHVFCLNENK